MAGPRDTLGRRLGWLDGAALDLRHAVAALKNRPGFTLITIAALASAVAVRTLERIALYTRSDVQLMHGDRAERLTAVQITDDFLPALGAQPILGRNFSP